MSKGLGRGIGALFPDILEVKQDETIKEVAVADLRANPYQPRKFFDEGAIEELAASIQQYGIIQPLIVRASLRGFEIVAGERRFRAAKSLNFETVPCVVRSLSEQDMMEIALLENLQREDLNAIEEATAYSLLLEKLDLTQEELAKRLGKSRPHIANFLRLLNLPNDVKHLIEIGKLSMAHGRVLVGLKDQSRVPSLVKHILEEQMNVRQLEALVQELNADVTRETTKKKVETKDVFVREQEDRLRNLFGTAVSIRKNEKNKGKIEIHFTSEDDLNRILSFLDDEE